MIGMAESKRKRIGAVGGEGMTDAEDLADHGFDLRLFSTAIADDRFFYLKSAVFVKGLAAERSGQKNDSPRMTERQGRFGAFCKKHTFYDNYIGSTFDDNFLKRREQILQPFMKRFVGCQYNAARCTVNRATGP